MSELEIHDVSRIESSIAHDLARRALIVTPFLLVGAGIWRGLDGVIAVALALGLVTANFLVSAAVLGRAAAISPNTLMGVALGGFLVKLIVLFGLALVVEQLDFVDFPLFVGTVFIAHLGLLAWETRSVSLSLAAPGLKPRP